MSTIYHISGWDDLSSAIEGDIFTLRPGKQAVEGVGVYFSESAPRLTAAEGCNGKPTAVIALDVSDADGWYQSKAAKAKKFGKPRTWHSDGKAVSVCVRSISEIQLACGTVRVLHCTWQFN